MPCFVASICLALIFTCNSDVSCNIADTQAHDRNSIIRIWYIYLHVCTCIYLVYNTYFLHTQNLQAPDSLFSDLHTFEFDDHPLSDDQTVMASVKMFRDSGLASSFRIDDRVSYMYIVHTCRFMVIVTVSTSCVIMCKCTCILAVDIDFFSCF